MRHLNKFLLPSTLWLTDTRKRVKNTFNILFRAKKFVKHKYYFKKKCVFNNKKIWWILKKHIKEKYQTSKKFTLGDEKTWHADYLVIHNPNQRVIYWKHLALRNLVLFAFLRITKTLIKDEWMDSTDAFSSRPTNQRQCKRPQRKWTQQQTTENCSQILENVIVFPSPPTWEDVLIENIQGKGNAKKSFAFIANNYNALFPEGEFLYRDIK